MKASVVALFLVGIGLTASVFVTAGFAQTAEINLKHYPSRTALPVYETVADGTFIVGPWHHHLVAVFIEPKAFTIDNVKEVFLLLSKENPGEDLLEIYAFSDTTEREWVVHWLAALQAVPYGSLPAFIDNDTREKRTKLASTYYSRYLRNDRDEGFTFYFSRENSVNVELKSLADPCSLTDPTMDLVRASRFCDEDVVKTLLDRGADPNLKSKYGGSPIVEASFFGENKIIDLLLEKGAYINQTSSSGWTALIAAIRHSQPATADLLLRRGADVNVRTEEGRTALMEAVRQQDRDLVEKLLVLGADARATDRFGETALTSAKKDGSQELISLLVKYGASM